METIATYLEKLTQETQQSEAAVMTLAIRSGLRQLWRENVLSRFLKGQITRDVAVEAVGIDWVELAERQHTAVLEDLEWALSQ
jgi:hypothetical protein